MNGARNHERLAGSTDLAVLKPFRLNNGEPPAWRLQASHGYVLFAVLAVYVLVGDVHAAPAKPSILATMWKWTPFLLQGFAFNILISFVSIIIGTLAGAALGLGQISNSGLVRSFAWTVTQFFRNAPWLVLLFYCIFLIPFEFELFGVTIPFPAWIKAVIGLSLPVMANFSEIVRGAVQSIPDGQWEAAESLAYTRRQTLWLIILPQCIKRMLPPWMNLYAVLTMATPLVSIVGVGEGMTTTGEILAAENRSDLLIPFYLYLLCLFFLYCYPIARWTIGLERKYAVKI
ncbi:amino acid ABC transporter permease [Hoeflea sp.]|uniref:amino acid ABC transporter permease n=1 Tax=Hoeflea sp. TaxID=1940281 RepID=UPI003B0240BF